MANFNISIDVSKHRNVNRHILGNNIEWINSCNNLYVNNSFNQNILKYIKEIPSTNLRYPGNDLSDAYLWCNGVGSNLERKLNRSNPNNSDTQEIIFGTDEFLTLCKELKSIPIFGINMFSDTPQSAADWVDYVNKKINKCGSCLIEHDPVNEVIPHGMYWELGFTPYLDAKFGYANMTASQYATLATEFVNKMKEVDPSLKIGIPLTNDNFNNLISIPSRNVQWSHQILNTFENNDFKFDYFILNNSVMPNITDIIEESEEELFSALMASHLWIEKDIKTIKREVKSHSPNPNRFVPFSITKYGAFFKNQIPYIEYSNSMAACIYIADFIKMCSKFEDILYANYWTLINDSFNSIIDTQGNKRNAFKVFEMLNTFCQGRYVNVEHFGGKFTNLAVGLVPESDSTSENFILDAGVTLQRTSEGIKLNVLLTNRSPNQDCPVELTFKNNTILKRKKSQYLRSILGYTAQELYSDYYFDTNLNHNYLILNNPLKVSVKKHSIMLLEILFELDFK